MRAYKFMQYVAIKQEIQDGAAIFVVNAIPLKNKNKSVVQKIPHPLGSDSLVFKTLEDAKQAVTRSGFSYILPDGTKESPVQNIPQSGYDYDTLIFETIKDKINSSNSNVSAAAILAISEFPKEETFDILFEKIGEENDSVRKNAISGISRYGKILQNRIIESLSSENWVARNSAISCILNILNDKNVELEKFIRPLAQTTNDSNPIVQANALAALGVVYRQYQKNKSGLN